MKILVWATTFGADLWALSYYLQKRGHKLSIALDDPKGFLQQPIQRLRPINARFIKRNLLRSLIGDPLFCPKVTLLDNWLPQRRLSQYAMMLWHGFGWKTDDLTGTLKDFSRTWGTIETENNFVRWGCFGQMDLDYRNQTTGISKDVCQIVGSAAHDLLIEPMEKRDLQFGYPFDLQARKTVLVSPTWNFGGMFALWPEGEDLLIKLFDILNKSHCNVILRMHDRFRYEKEYRNKLDDVVSAYPNVWIKYKNEHPDNILDLQVADVLLTNYSSIANLYYATGKPAIHILPGADHEQFSWRIRRRGRVVKESKSLAEAWKLDPYECGGLVANSSSTLVEAVEQALSEPHCCMQKSEEFIQKHMVCPKESPSEKACTIIESFM